MQCTNPMYAVRVDNPKRPIKIISYKTAPPVGGLTGIVDQNGEMLTYDGMFFDGKQWRDKSELLKLNCGQCAYCRLMQSKEWADRCTMEAMMHPKDSCWFLTLTYEDSKLPPFRSGSYISDSIYPGSVDKTALSDFAHNLNESMKYIDASDGIRYYGCSEYGKIPGLRPHYHMIMFGSDIPDLKFYKQNKMHDSLYTSERISSTWKNGYVVIGKFDWRTAAYTARYVMKKRTGKGSDEFYENFDILPEYTRASNRPGIAAPYFDAHWEDIYYGDQKIVLPAIDGKPNITTAPRYFDKLFERKGPEFADDLFEIKQKRRKYAEEIAKAQQSIVQYQLDEEEYLDFEASIFEKKPQFRLDI